MAKPHRDSIDIWRGSTYLFEIRPVFPNGDPFIFAPGDDIIFRGESVAGVQLFRIAKAGMTAILSGAATIGYSGKLTPSQTRSCTPGLTDKFEIELRRDGNEFPFRAGNISVEGGANDDA